MSLGPSSKYNIILNFDEVLTEPSKYNIVLNFADKASGEDQTIGGIGLDSFTPGQTVIRNRNERIQPAGITNKPFGLPAVKNQRHLISPYGLFTARYGTSTVVNKDRFISPPGYMAARYGVVAVRSTKTVLTLTGFADSRVGTQWVSEANRTVRGLGIGPTWRFGNVWVSNGRRYVSTAGRVSSLFGQGTIADRTKYLKVTTFVTAEYGRSRVELENRAVYASGRDNLVFGAANARLGVRYIYPTWIYSYRSGYGWLDYGLRYLHQVDGSDGSVVAARAWVADKTQSRFFQGFDSASVSGHAAVKDPRRGFLVKPILIENLQKPQIYNRDTFLEPFVFERGQAGETLYGTAWVAQRNREFPIPGINSLRFGLGVQVYYYVGDVDQVTLRETTRWGSSLVADRIRFVYPEGREPSLIPRSHVRNLGLGISTQGAVQTIFGKAWVEQGTRYVKPPTVQLDNLLVTLVPVPWLSAGQRVIEAFSTPGRGAMAGTDVIVRLHTRRITPAAIQPPVVVRFDMEVRIHFNYIKPFERVTSSDDFGLSEVYLYDRAVSPKAWPPKEDSQHTVFFRDRRYIVTMGDVSVVPPPRIADRRLVVNLFNKGLAPLGVGGKGKIENVERDPPSLQKLFMQSIWAWDPLVTRLEQVSEPNIGIQTIADAKVGETLEVGECLVYTNAIVIESGMWARNMGSPTVSPFYIYPETLGEHLSVQDIGEAFFSPYHIFAPSSSEAPDLYRPYNPNLFIDRHVIDGRKYQDSSGGWEGTKIGPVWVPRPIVTHWVQQQFASGFNSLRMGSARVDRPGAPKGTPQYINGKGINSMRIGWLHFPPDLLYMQGFVSFVAGKSTIREVPSGILKVPSMPGFVLGRPVIDYFDRFVQPRAWDSRVFGTQWASYRVRGFKPSGVVSKTVIPELHYIDYKIRRIAPEGGDHLNPPVAMTGKPTTVRNQYNGKVLSAKSVAPSALGVPAIAQRTQHVAPRALFAVPLFPPTVKGRTEIQALGAEHTEFGHVRKYEEGVVYPHELISTGFGRAFVVTPREMQGFDSAVVEYPVIAKHVGAYGTPGEQFGVTVLANEVCCEGCG